MTRKKKVSVPEYPVQNTYSSTIMTSWTVKLLKEKKNKYINYLIITNLCMIWSHIDYIYKQQSIVCVSSW